MIQVIFPRWLFPNNLGDSVLFTCIPLVLKKEYPNDDIICITHGELIDVLIKNKFVNKAYSGAEAGLDNINPSLWIEQAINGNQVFPPNVKVIYPEWNNRLWSYWNERYDYLSDHPTANLVTVNYLLQLGLEKYLYDGTDLTPVINTIKLPREEMSLGIVPATKLSGRASPHPGCDGRGFRFNGDNGESWKLFVSEIRKLNSKIKIIEYSYENFGFGDEHIPHKADWFELASQASRPKVVLLSDGGMHHVFNSQQTPVVYLSAQSINKPHYYKTKNSKVYWDLFSECLDKCGTKLRNINSWWDIPSFCDLSCQKVNPTKLAQYIVKDYFSE